MTGQNVRRRGRELRMERRATAGVPVVRKGMKGGQFAPLTNKNITDIYESALRVLETTGIADVEPHYKGLFVSAGCFLNSHDRVCFPKTLVEDLIRVTPKTVWVHGQDRDAAIEFGGARVHLCTGGTGVLMFDDETGQVRDSQLADLYDVSRIADALPNIHCCNRQLVARDVLTTEDMDINTAYAIASATRKPFGAGVTVAESAGKVRQLMNIIMGDDTRFDHEPICWSGGTFVISPLRAPGDGQDKLEAIVRAGFPLHQVMVPQSGTTGPASLAGTLVQCLAESLFVLCFVQLIKRGHPFIIGCWPFVSDLRTGAFSGGNGEQALLMAASAQIMNYLGLPSSTASGMSDSKRVDVQAGMEKALTTSMAALSGSTLVYTFPGMLGSIMGISPAQMFIDDEIAGNALRILRGIEVNDETLAIGVIGDAAVDPGHFIAHEQTLALMESEYFYPRLADRSSLSQWQSENPPDMATRARTMARQTLALHFPRHISDATDEELRRSFNILLPRGRMQSGYLK
jgi:trimethylamine---corrinoid protein Co-methyltransferase